MINTDKYEGHTEGLWFDGEPTKISNAISNAFLQLNPNEIGKANARLAVDAPLLLAEVKRLREKNDILEWAEKTHPVWLDNLKEGYRRHKEAKKNEIKE